MERQQRQDHIAAVEREYAPQHHYLRGEIAMRQHHALRCASRTGSEHDRCERFALDTRWRLSFAAQQERPAEFAQFEFKNARYGLAQNIAQPLCACGGGQHRARLGNAANRGQLVGGNQMVEWHRNRARV